MRTENRGRRLGILFIIGLLAVLGLAGAMITQQPAGRPAAVAGQDPDKSKSVPIPGSGESDVDRMAAAAAVWANRYTYPSGEYNPAWLQQAAAQDRLVPRGIPAGQVIYNRANSHSPLALDPNGFLSLGPAPANTNNPQVGYQFGRVSGRVNALAINPTTPAVAYLGTAGGGVWKTTNCCTAATTWTLTTDDPLVNTTDITSLAVDPNNPTTVYAGTGDLQYNFDAAALGGSQGILKSTNAGASWTVVGADVFVPAIQPPYTGYVKQAVGQVQVDPRNSNTVVAGTRYGLYVSNNAGVAWTGPCFTNAFQDTQGQIITGLILSNNGTSTDMYVAVGVEATSLNGATGVYKATLPAGGCPATADWALLNNNWPAGTGGGTAGPTLPGRIDLAISPSQPGVLYAQAESRRSGGGYQPGGQLGVWQTTNGGATWTQQSDVTALRQCDNTSGDYNQNGYDQGLAVDPNNPQVLFMDTHEIWKSTDGGRTFANLTCVYTGQNPRPVHPDQHGLLFVPGSSTTLLAANDGGVYLTADAGATWSQLNDSLNTIEFYSGDLTANFATAAQIGAAGGTQDNGDMVYTGPASGPALWQGVIGGDGFFARVDGVTGSPTGGTWFVGNNSGQFWRSTNGPTGPYDFLPVPWNGTPRERQAFALPVDIQRNDCAAGGCTHLIVGSYHVWETTDSGTTWANSSPDLTGGAAHINYVRYAAGTSTVAMAGTSDGRVAYGFGLGTGAPGTWVNIEGGNAVLPNRSVLSVATDPTNPLVGYAALGSFDESTPGKPGHLFQATCTANCGAVTWVNKTGNLPNIPLDSVIANPRYGQQVFVGSDWGLYFTNDITANPPVWQRFQAGLPNVVIWDLTVDRGNTTLAAWTRNRGLYVWPLANGPINPPVGTPTPGPATPTPTGCGLSFSDVPQSAYFYTPVTYLACRGVVSGYGDGTFRPYNNTTRGQMVKIIVNGFAVPAYTPPNGNTFADVPSSFPFFSVIEAAAHANVVSGYTCGGPDEPCDAENRPYFRPYANVNRGQLSKIVVAAARWTTVTPANATFADVGTASPYFPFVETAYCRGVISGYNCGGEGEPCNGTNQPYFRPFNSAIRGQIAKIVYGALTAAPACATVK